MLNFLCFQTHSFPLKRSSVIDNNNTTVKKATTIAIIHLIWNEFSFSICSFWESISILVFSIELQQVAGVVLVEGISEIKIVQLNLHWTDLTSVSKKLSQHYPKRITTIFEKWVWHPNESSHAYKIFDAFQTYLQQKFLKIWWAQL